jgi:hypothetical protein
MATEWLSGGVEWLQTRDQRDPSTRKAMAHSSRQTKSAARLGWTSVLFVLLSATAANAHHSYSMFDREKTDTISGTVKSMDMVNPHGWLQVEAPGPQGAIVEYSLEMGGPGQMERIGWTQQILKAGDKVTVRLHPLRDGSHGGHLVSVVLPGGQTLQGGGPLQGLRGGPDR